MSSEGSSPFRVLTIGSGAIGTYVGGSLALAGCQVTFLERPHRVQALQRQGLSLTLSDGSHTVSHPHVVGALEGALDGKRYDLILFALKAYHTAGLTAQLESLETHVPPVLCLQNGVGNEEILAGALGQEKVLAGTVTTSVTRHRPGSITVRKKRGLGITANHPLSSRLQAICQKAGLQPRIYKDPRSMKWTKLVTNLMGNASCAILDMTPGEVYRHPGLYELEIKQLREALAVMDSLQLQPVSLPGLPSRLLARVINHVPTAISQPLLARVIQRGRGGKMPSFHIDLQAGKGESEVSFLNGAVVREGAKLGLPTPANRLLHHTLQQLVQGEMSRDTYAHQPDRLLSRLEHT